MPGGVTTGFEVTVKAASVVPESINVYTYLLSRSAVTWRAPALLSPKSFLFPSSTLSHSWALGCSGPASHFRTHTPGPNGPAVTYGVFGSFSVSARTRHFKARSLVQVALPDRSLNIIAVPATLPSGAISPARSEERRVGKECRSLWWPSM